MENTVGAKWKRFSTLNAARRYIKRRSQRQVQIAIFGEGQAAVGFDTEGEETEEEEASLSQVYAREEAQLGKTIQNSNRTCISDCETEKEELEHTRPEERGGAKPAETKGEQ